MPTCYDVVVIGGGPAGLAAAYSAKTYGADRVLVLERDSDVGGILNQCIHNGFGLHYFKEELTGPEYAARFMELAKDSGVEFMTNSMVLKVESHKVHAVNSNLGYLEIDAKAIVLAMGCRERTRGALAIPGDRPAGIFTAGLAQRYMNIEGWMVGRKVVILGSGDIGLIMARRLTLEGAKVLACVEICPYSNGLARNIVQCLDDYDIPLYLSHTITKINGLHRVESVEISEVGPDRKPIPGTERTLDCDTVLLSVGLIPENELTSQAQIPIDNRTKGAIVYENRETLTDGVFACGNVLHVHDLVDFVTQESLLAGKNAAIYAKGERNDSGRTRPITVGDGLSYSVPQIIRTGCLDRTVDVFFRVKGVFGRTRIVVKDDLGVIASFDRDRMAPGEMERITLLREKLESSSGEIRICLEALS